MSDDVTTVSTNTQWGDYNGYGNQSTDAPPDNATTGLGTGQTLNVTDGAELQVSGYFNLNAATINVTDGASVNVVPALIGGDLTNAAGGTINIDGGSFSVSNNFNANQGVYNITNGKISVGNDFNGNIAVFNIYQGGVLDAGTNYSNINDARFNIMGGTVVFAGIANVDGENKIDFHNVPGGQLVIGSTSLSDLSADPLNVQNFVYGDQIKIATSTDYGDSALTTVVDGSNLDIQSDGQTIVTIAGYADSTASNAYPAPTATYSDGYLLLGEQSDTGACFLAGSMIETPQGKCAVEDIRAGDEINTFDWHDNTYTAKPVIWTGKKKASVRPERPDDEAGYPVRILKDALAQGIPCKDMLITAEHCLFFDGKFIPVRMLVNGRSIFYDRSILSYTYYHVETEEHAVIVADGMLTESYLDTGNRRTFQQGGSVVRIGHKPRTWLDDAAAPLGVGRDFVEPIFRRIEEHAVKTGHSVRFRAPVPDEDADLHLITETGAIIRKMRDANGYAVFMIPAGVENVQIMSRTSRPSDMIGPYVDDRRQLGVLIGDIKLFEGNTARPISTHLANEAPDGWYDGWYAPHNAPCRWTGGQASLHLGQRHPTLMGLLCLEILAGGPYIVRNDDDAPASIPASLPLTA